jgi:murein L,D-transpeptidase YcbB/YkuD
MSIRLRLFVAVVATIGPACGDHGAPVSSPPPDAPASSSAPAPSPTPVASSTVTASEIAAIGPTLDATSDEVAAAERFYAARDGLRAWTDAQGDLTDAARQVLERLSSAERHGLRAEDYDMAAPDDGGDGPESRTRRDVAVTCAALRFMHDLHLGRVDPRRVGIDLATWDDPHDFARVLAEAVAADRVPQALDELAPPFAAYHALVDALARYRALHAETWPPLLDLPAALPGEALADADAIRRRLVAFGDLSRDDAVGPPQLDEPLTAAVRRFQGRHGLTPDGVLGPKTRAALRVPLATRIAQIELALERLRWRPELGARRVIAVNIPMFRLWAWDAGRLGDAPVLAMDVVVGRALRHETPVLVEPLDAVVFRPYWNVPASIVRDEVLPALARDPGWLAREQMEIVRGPGDDAPVVADGVPDPAAIAGLVDGTLRLRQRPGPHNALGAVKFVLPNRDAVYLHDTPARGLFARERRDMSHGCIRVADPAALAAWVLHGVSGWDAERVHAAMRAAAPRRVRAAAAVDVVIYYLTAAVFPDGELHFADDVYGRDAVLASLLDADR